MARRMTRRCTVVLIAVVFLADLADPAHGENLLPDPSFEKGKPRDKFGGVFAEWGGWIYEGVSRFEVGEVARTGEHSCEMVGAVGGKIRLRSPEMVLEPGRYRATVYLRGLGLGKGRWGRTIDFHVGRGKWFTLKKSGTFGWTPLTYVFDWEEGQAKFRLFVGLWEEGHLWVDDASLERVGADVALTPEPVLGEEETAVAMPGPLGERPVRCAHCFYRNNPAWGKCYACGRKVEGKKRTFASPAVRVFADFEDGKRTPFTAGEAVAEHPTRGKFALRLDESYTTIEGPQNWSEHDYVHFDVFNPQVKPVKLYVEVRDAQTTDYWTRVNLYTVAPPGTSTVTLPTALYVGEKSRPGRPLLRDKVTRFVVSVGKEGPVFLDNFRLERLDTAEVTFDELYAFDFGPPDAPVMEGFTAAGMGTTYSKGRGFGWTKVTWWRDFNVRQPDLLYQDFVVPRPGTFRLDVPNGKYHIWMNIDSANGFWGEVQLFRARKVAANGKVVVDETTDLETFTKKYFCNAEREDLPGIDTFEAYVEKMFDEKAFEVEVADGKLELSMSGDAWGICLSALVVYPDDRRASGEKFLSWVKERRRKQFDDYFKQTNPARVGGEPPPTGYRVFKRCFRDPANAHDGPREGEELTPGRALDLTVAQGEEAALTFAVQPVGDLGPIELKVSKLTHEGGGVLGGDALRPGWIDYRLSRVAMDGSIYTVKPRYWHPTPAPSAAGVTRNFWIRVKVPADAAPGRYRGVVTVAPKKLPPRAVPVTLRVLPFALDPITDVAVGPWGSGIRSRWFRTEDAAREYSEKMFEKALDAIRDMGCTSFSGRPQGVRVKLADGKVELDATEADRQMALIRSKGFTHLVSNYGSSLTGAYPLYRGISDADARKKGFKDAASLMKAMWQAIDDHAVANDWAPVAWNLCDEPVGAAIPRAARNVKAHAEVAEGLKRMVFMGATSMSGGDAKDPHYELVRALPLASLNRHDEASIAVIREAGNQFSFYNGANRWTYGRYMKMLVRKHRMRLRLSWHYNVVAGDPYYALDCREDDYCWFNTNAKGDLVPSLRMLGEILPGLNDYRYLSTLERLIAEKANHPQAAAARKVFEEMMDLEAGTDRDRQVDFEADRRKVVQAIESLLK